MVVSSTARSYKATIIAELSTIPSRVITPLKFPFGISVVDEQAITVNNISRQIGVKKF